MLLSQAMRDTLLSIPGKIPTYSRAIADLIAVYGEVPGMKRPFSAL